MRTLPSTLPAILVLALAPPAVAETTPIGLSEVRAAWFDDDGSPAYGAAPFDHFGSAFATGDFNGDGADDLAIGIPDDDEAADGCDSCGMVVVRWGAPRSGLANTIGPTVLHQALPGSPDLPGAGDLYGSALAAGDFNGDLFDDLAVGIPAGPLYGAVQVYYGGSTGFQTEHSEYFSEFTAAAGDAVCMASDFGSALAAGNFDDDPFDDLAIGAFAGCDVIEGRAEHGGVVYVAHGQEFGLLPWYGYRISQEAIFIQEDAEDGDQFGRALAAGDFDSDSYDDLVIGVPRENDHGILQIVFGSQFGLLYATNILWAPGALGEVPEAGDRLGFALAVGDFDGDLYEDLAIGNPVEDLGGSNEILDAGSIAIAFGSNSGFDLSRTLRFQQGTLYDDEEADREGDRFGWSLAVGDFDTDGLDDLAVGHPEDRAAGTDAGAVSILMGSFGQGLGERHRLLVPKNEGLPGEEYQGQNFGWALAAADFDGNGCLDLAIGVPRYYVDGIVQDAGGAAVLYGSLFADGFEVGSFDRWSGWAPLP